jgi:cytochrome c-type biogenesis protein CcmE
MGRKAKMVTATAIIAAVTGYIAYVGASSSWRYYVLVDECVTEADQLGGKRLRVSGRVAAGTLRISDHRRSASFRLQGNQLDLPVQCKGALPDNLAEDMDVVVEGVLQPDGGLRGDRVITRCASKYAPKHESQTKTQVSRPTS